jgi:ABC-type sugar transport system substrate-binding protein
MRRVMRQKLALAGVLLLSACSGGGDYSPAASHRIVLGLSQVVTAANWNAANTESIQQAARAAGVEVRLDDANRSQEKQVAALRAFARQHVDVIALSPVVETGWETVLREIRSAGIPVILTDRAIEVSDSSLYASLVGSDFVEEGRRAARWLLEHERHSTDEIDIVELQGTVGSAPANDRKQGFAEIIATNPRYRIIRSQSADFSRETAKRIMEEFLQSEGKRIRVLFAHSDSMALGAIEAIESAGFKSGTDILVISIEGSREGLKAIIAGKLNVSVECNPLFGPQLVQAVEDVAAGKAISRRIVTEESMFTADTAAQELARRAY